MRQRIFSVKHLVCGPERIELDAHHKMKFQFRHQNVAAIIAASFCRIHDCHLLIVYVLNKLFHLVLVILQSINVIIPLLFLQSANGTFVNGASVSKERHQRLKENDIISFGFDMTGEFNKNRPIAFVYTLIRDEAVCIELSDSEDDSAKCHVSEHDDTIKNVTVSEPNEFIPEVLITVSTQPMVINPFAVLKECEMQQQKSQPERDESSCLEPNADNENNAKNIQ